MKLRFALLAFPLLVFPLLALGPVQPKGAVPAMRIIFDLGGVVRLPEPPSPCTSIRVEARVAGQTVGHAVVGAMVHQNGSYACPYRITGLPYGKRIVVIATANGSPLQPSGWSGSIMLNPQPLPPGRSPASVSALDFQWGVGRGLQSSGGDRPNVQMQPRDIGTLSAQDRLKLPDETKVSISWGGAAGGGKPVTTTLGALRANHAALLASRNRVRTLVARLRTSGKSAYYFTKVYGPSQIVHLSPANGATPAPSTLPLVSTTGFSTDYQQFCSSVPATVCLYYPAGITWYEKINGIGGNLVTLDPLIMDSNVCSAEGGSMLRSRGTTYGCLYAYPSLQTVNFVPPRSGFKTTGQCQVAPGVFSSQSDWRGAVQIADAGASGWPTTAVPTATFCYLQVQVNH